MKPSIHYQQYILLAALVFMITACSSSLPARSTLSIPTPRSDTDGRYLSPYTSDNTVAPWVEKGVSAKMGAAVGQIAGKKAGTYALKSIPVVGGILGKKVGKRIGREVALELVGGRSFMVETSDQSFDSIDDMVVFLYVVHSDNEHFPEVYDLTVEIYPEMEKRWSRAIRNANR